MTTVDGATVLDTAADDATADDDASHPAPKEGAARQPAGKRRVPWPRVLAYGVLPAIALLLALAAGYLKWIETSARNAELVRSQSVQIASDGTVALLSYRPQTVDNDLGAARNRLTGRFKDAYTALTRDVVIPGAKQKQISATASVPAAASVSATENRAVVLVFVNQTVTSNGDSPPLPPHACG